MAVSHRFRLENAVELLLVLAAFFVGPRLRRLMVGGYPLALVGLLYDSMKAIENVGVSPDTVHLCDLRAHELELFGITVNGQRVRAGCGAMMASLISASALHNLAGLETLVGSSGSVGGGCAIAIRLTSRAAEMY